MDNYNLEVEDNEEDKGAEVDNNRNGEDRDNEVDGPRLDFLPLHPKSQ